MPKLFIFRIKPIKQFEDGFLKKEIKRWGNKQRKEKTILHRLKSIKSNDKERYMKLKLDNYDNGNRI